jgi:hypothetical protein
MNTLCNETLSIVVNTVTDDSIPILRGCNKEFKSLTSDRYISVQSKHLLQITEELKKNTSNGIDALWVSDKIKSIVQRNIEQPVSSLPDMLSVIDMCQYVCDVIAESNKPSFYDEDFKWDVSNYPNALRYYDDHKYEGYDPWIPELFDEHCNW